MAYRTSVTINPTAGNSGSITSQGIFGWQEVRRATALAGLGVDDYGATNIATGHYVNVSAPIITGLISAGALSFDLSSILSSKVVKAVELKLYAKGSNSAALFGNPPEEVDLYLVKYDWGSGALATGDFINLDTLNDPETYPILGRRNTTAWPLTEDISVGASFLCNQEMIDYIQSLIGTASPARIYIVDKRVLLDLRLDALTRFEKGLELIDVDAVEEAMHYTFDRDSAELIITYE